MCNFHEEWEREKDSGCVFRKKISYFDRELAKPVFFLEHFRILQNNDSMFIHVPFEGEKREKTLLLS